MRHVASTCTSTGIYSFSGKWDSVPVCRHWSKMLLAPDARDGKGSSVIFSSSNLPDVIQGTEIMPNSR